MQKATYWNNKGNGSELNGRTATILNQDDFELYEGETAVDFDGGLCGQIVRTCHLYFFNHPLGYNQPCFN